jgi:hypothetical protein
MMKSRKIKWRGEAVGPYHVHRERDAVSVRADSDAEV